VVSSRKTGMISLGDTVAEVNNILLKGKPYQNIIATIAKEKVNSPGKALCFKFRKKLEFNSDDDNDTVIHEINPQSIDFERNNDVHHSSTKKKKKLNTTTPIEGVDLISDDEITY